MFFQFSYGRDFPLGEKFGEDLVHTRFLRDGMGNSFLIPREHDDFFHTQSVEALDGMEGFWTQCVCKREHSQSGYFVSLADTDPNTRFAVLGKGSRRKSDCIHSGCIAFAEKTLAADEKPTTADRGFRTLSGGRLKVGRLG